MVRRLLVGGVLVAALAASSASQARIINFGVSVIGSPTYTGATPGASLDMSSELNLTGLTLEVTSLGSADTSGLILGSTALSLTPTDLVYGTGSTATGLDIVKSWTAGGDTYTETLTSATIGRGSANAITLTFLGTMTDTLGDFMGTSADMILTANQSGGGTNAVTASFTEHVPANIIPEPSTYAMMLLGFAGLGLAAGYRRRQAISLA